MSHGSRLTCTRTLLHTSYEDVSVTQMSPCSLSRTIFCWNDSVECLLGVHAGCANT